MPTPSTPQTAPQEPIIVIDAGHGGKDPGAIGPTGLHEAAVALDLAMRLGHIADAKGFEVLYTRYSDVFVPLLDRAKVANRSGAALFVSIHCNAASSPEAWGTEVFTSPGQTRSDRVAHQIALAIRSAFPAMPLRADLQDGDLDKEANFQVLRETACPAVLVEVGFISHARTEEQMRTPEWRTRMAETIFAGILGGLS